ncbi:MAG: hypothetical protein Ct9H300mP20_16530 [Gammaproteobacteria bacterium]|nr:MAG: hypothetical protein Ct9H300mP20_16530 [Gammaproteobacteria bacterium]
MTSLIFNLLSGLLLEPLTLTSPFLIMEYILDLGRPFNLDIRQLSSLVF